MIFSSCATRFRDRERAGPRRKAPPQTTAFHGLPYAERRQANRQIARPFQQRQGKRHLRGKPKGGTEDNIGPLLYADSVGYRKGDGPDRVEEALDHNDRRASER